MFINTENYKEWYIKNSFNHHLDFLNVIIFAMIYPDLFLKEIEHYR